MDSGVYIITNKENGKVYIGSTIDFEGRWSRHRHDLQNNCHHNRHLQRSWNKYGESVFEFGILEYLDNLEELIRAEQFWLDIYRGEGGDFYNTALSVVSPMLGREHTEESKRKIGESNKGRIVSPETRCEISKSLKGKPKSEEHRRKISKSLTGKKLSEEHKRKLSEAKMGHPVSKETRRKISRNHKGMLGKHHSEESKRRISKGRKRKNKSASDK